MRLKIEIDQEEDGRFIAEVMELPGVLAYGQTREEAVACVQALAQRVLTDRVAAGETALLSEPALAEWSQPAEDAAWSHLEQPEP